jgi:hypothetical protein
MNTSIPIVSGCAPRTGPWPEQHTFECACCRDTIELLVNVLPPPKRGDPAEPLSDRRTRIALAMRAISGEHEWFLVKGRGTADWVCKRCVRSALDPHDPAFLDAARRWCELAGVDYSVADGVAA